MQLTGVTLKDFFLPMTESVRGWAVGTSFMWVCVISAICASIILSFLLLECCESRFRVGIILLRVAGKKDQSAPLQNTRQLTSGRAPNRSIRTTCAYNSISSSDESQQEVSQGNQVDWPSLTGTTAFPVSELGHYQTAIYAALEKVEQLTREKKVEGVQAATCTSNHNCVSVDDSC
jgi:hypothetical protein